MLVRRGGEEDEKDPTLETLTLLVIGETGRAGVGLGK